MHYVKQNKILMCGFWLLPNEYLIVIQSLNPVMMPRWVCLMIHSPACMAEGADWLEDLSMKVQDMEFADGEIEIYYVDIVGGTIDFLEIFLGLIQAFDYVIMVPIVVLSLSVLIYGLILSPEQRRREISIHRVIGASAKDLRGMVLLELAVVSFVACIAGYLLAMAAVPVVLASVGFMKFEALGFNVDPALSFGATLFTAITTHKLSQMRMLPLRKSKP